MHLSPLLIPLLPFLSATLAADQVPLSAKAAGWFDKAKSFIPSGSIPNPIDAGASAVAAQKVERINVRNWQRKLDPKSNGEEEWMIYFTGGNKTCFGRCGHVNLMWNESVPLLSALPQPPSRPLHLGSVDCDKENVLCTALSVGVPGVWHLLLPEKSSSGSTPKSPLHIVRMNLTTTTPQDFVTIPSNSKSRYLESEEYEGLFHPIDGWLRKLGLLMPLGYFLWVLGNTPSWLFMIVISFISRQMMSRRMAGSPGAGGPGAGPAGAPAPAVPAGGGAAAAGGAAGAKKKK